MVENGSRVTQGTNLHTRVCIIGSGPAGATAAFQIRCANPSLEAKDIIILEGSRQIPYVGAYYMNSWDDKVKLYNGKADGQFLKREKEFLILPSGQTNNFAWERERVYGGTGSHWGGQSRPLDPIVFERRLAADGTHAFPGWPIQRDDLEDWYDRTALQFGLDPDFTLGHWVARYRKEQDPSFALPPAIEGFDTEIYQFMNSPQDRNPAIRTWKGPSGQSGPLTDFVDVYVNASCLQIETAGGSVIGVRAASMKAGKDGSLEPDTEFTVTADLYVLACGAVANARQLLLSNVGNEYDLVGRYFMCHPYQNESPISTISTPVTPEQLRFMGWLNEDGNGVQGRFIPSALSARSEQIGRCWFWASGAGGRANYYFEMTPNRESRVTLADTTDPVFGQRQTHITWQLSDVNDKATYERSTRLLAAGGVEIDCPTWSELEQRLVVNGHHIGTTRMADSPVDGVVDRHHRVHSTDNLYVAGSSVFPSTGISNPTFTILAMSMRLGSWLAARLGSSSAAPMPTSASAHRG